MRSRLRSGPPLLIDGPTGTEIERRGVDTSSPIWSAAAVLHHPDVVRAVHEAYAAAGADVHTAVTFRADRAAFVRAGLDDDAWRDTVRDAVHIVRDVVEAHGGWVAGSMAPVGDCYAPDEVPADRVLARSHGDQARLLAKAGVDLVLVETMNTVREAVLATRAVVDAGLVPWTSFVVGPDARLLSGEPLGAALDAVVSAGAEAVLVNCSSLPATHDAVPVLNDSGVPWGAYANGSLSDPRKGWTSGMEVTDDAFVSAAEAWLAAGARLVGSCCGTTPETTRRLRAMFEARD